MIRAATIFLVLTLACNAALAADMQGVVLQVSEEDPAIWRQALNNAMNVQQDLGQNAQIEIVAHGPGLKMLSRNSSVSNRLTTASGKGISLVACGSTMKKAGMTARDLHPLVRVVPSGVLEIIQKQKQGWAYVKP